MYGTLFCSDCSITGSRFVGMTVPFSSRYCSFSAVSSHFKSMSRFSWTPWDLAKASFSASSRSLTPASRALYLLTTVSAKENNETSKKCQREINFRGIWEWVKLRFRYHLQFLSQECLPKEVKSQKMTSKCHIFLRQGLTVVTLLQCLMKYGHLLPLLYPSLHLNKNLPPVKNVVFRTWQM